MSLIPTRPPNHGSVPEEAYKAVNDAYYAELVKAPAGARSRGQTAYTIAAAVVTALVTAGVVTDFKEQEPGVKAFGLLAVGLWIATALIFMLAVGVGVRSVHRKEMLDKSGFAVAVAENVQGEVDEINRRIRIAWFVAVVASLITVVTFILAFSISKPVKKSEVNATITLTPRGRANIMQLCNLPAGSQFSGLLDQDSLSHTRATVSVSGSTGCPIAGQKTLVLKVPSKQILSYSYPKASK